MKCPSYHTHTHTQEEAKKNVYKLNVNPRKCFDQISFAKQSRVIRKISFKVQCWSLKCWINFNKYEKAAHGCACMTSKSDVVNACSLELNRNSSVGLQKAVTLTWIRSEMIRKWSNRKQQLKRWRRMFSMPSSRGSLICRAVAITTPICWSSPSCRASCSRGRSATSSCRRNIFCRRLASSRYPKAVESLPLWMPRSAPGRWHANRSKSSPKYWIRISPNCWHCARKLSRCRTAPSHTKKAR